MPVFGKTPPRFKAQKDVSIDYDNFSGGFNNIFRPTELSANELAQADNLMLTGKGVVTGRWGSTNHYLAGSGNVRLITEYQDIAGTKTLLSLTDAGYVTTKNNASFTIITGASFASGFDAQATQLGGNVYITTGNESLVKYTGSVLQTYATLSTPANVGLSNISGATGITTWSWRVSALSDVGETLASTSLSLASLPLDLGSTLINVNWGAVSAASGILTGYTIYRGLKGDETYIATVGPETLSYEDTGSPQSDIILPVVADTTGGAVAKHILKFDNRLILSGIKDDPSLVLISAKYPFQDRFNWADGGGYLRINPNGGDRITGLGISGSQTQGGTTPASVLVFFENGVHQLVLKQVSVGNFLLLDPQSQVLAPNGTSSAKTIVPVENNTFYFGRQGLYTVGSEAAFLNQIRTKEVSARIRTYVQNLSQSDRNNAVAGFIDFKYLLSFPDRKETIVYDWERAAFMGPWITPWGVTGWLDHVDNDGKQRRLAGATDGYVKEFSTGLNSDSGQAIKKLLRTKKEDFGDWSVMKVVKTLYVLFRNIKGSVTVNIRLEERSGQTVTEKSFNITGAVGTAGWGADQWGQQQWGQSQGTVTLTGEEIIRYAQLYKTARVLQIEVVSSGASDNWEFLGIRSTAQPMEEGSLSSTTRV